VVPLAVPLRGVGAASPSCDRLLAGGDFPHSCRHGEGPLHHEEGQRRGERKQLVWWLMARVPAQQDKTRQYRSIDDE
jgi:hypothetical protein